MFTVTAVRRAARASGEKLSTETKRHILLENLPRTTLPTDIRRALRHEKLVGVEDVHLELFRFTSNRRAYITLLHPDFLRQNLAKLENFSISGCTVTARPCPEPPIIRELRGAKGRKAAIERGALSGLIASGAMSNGRQVCIWGLPPKASAESVKSFLEHNKIDTLGDKPEIYHVDLQANEFSLYSRYLIRTPSISNSYHIVRRIHMTYFRPDLFGTKFQVRACVVR